MNPYLSHALIGVLCAVLGVCAGASLGKRPWFKSQFVMNISMVVISIAAMTGLFVAINDYRGQTSCQSEYNLIFSSNLKERSEIADSERTATRQAIAAVLSPTMPPEQKRAAIENWDKALSVADQRRVQNPVPVTPECAKDAS